MFEHSKTGLKYYSFCLYTNLCFQCQARHESCSGVASIIFLNEADDWVDNQKTDDSKKILPVRTLALNKEVDEDTEVLHHVADTETSMSGNIFRDLSGKPEVKDQILERQRTYAAIR